VRLHRRATDATLSLIAAHLVVVMVVAPSRLRLLEFFGAPWRAQAGIGSLVALGALIHTSVRRERMGMHYNGWRAAHAWLGATAFALAVVHVIGVHRYLCTGAGWFGLGGLVAAGLGSVIGLRVVRQRRVSRERYVIERVVQERGGATTVHLVADGHGGRSFAPGQFAWLKLADRVYRWTEHPFSYSSSAENPLRPAFTMKGAFALRAAGLRGAHVLIDGPHGGFRPSRRSTGMALVAGGIGITPCMSFLRTAHDRRDGRPYTLFYVNRSYDAIAFREELDQLATTLELKVVHLVAQLDARILDRHLPDDVRRWQFFVCGSRALTEGAVQALRGLGVPAERIHAERFVTV
jgi:predicted ferric reductase